MSSEKPKLRIFTKASPQEIDSDIFTAINEGKLDPDEVCKDADRVWEAVRILNELERLLDAKGLLEYY